MLVLPSLSFLVDAREERVTCVREGNFFFYSGESTSLLVLAFTSIQGDSNGVAPVHLPFPVRFCVNCSEGVTLVSAAVLAVESES